MFLVRLINSFAPQILSTFKVTKNKEITVGKNTGLKLWHTLQNDGMQQGQRLLAI